MLYLIEPDATVRMISYTLGELRVMQTRDRRDPADLAWAPAPAEIEASHVLTAALRHGVPTRRGLIVHPGFVETLMEPERLRLIAAEQHRIEEQLATLDQGGVDTSAIRSNRRDAKHKADDAIHEADVAADRLRSEPVKDELQSAWERLGGTRLASAAF